MTATAKGRNEVVGEDLPANGREENARANFGAFPSGGIRLTRPAGNSGGNAEARPTFLGTLLEA
jgi:hypothetical protein